jgi:hypothetical protein
MAEQSTLPERPAQTEPDDAIVAVAEGHPGPSHPASSHPASSRAASSHPAIEQLLIHTEGSEPARARRSASDAPALAFGLHIGMLRTITARVAVVSVEGRDYEAVLAQHVDGDFLRAALEEAEPVLMQNGSNGELCIMGVLKGKFPSRLVGDRVLVTGETEVVVRSGRSALRLREDGVVDLIGARISASSRGLLRLVGRALRLN